jgi:hypothetical protein
MLAKARANVRGTWKGTIGRIELLLVRQADDVEIGLDRIERLSGDLDLHGRRV